MLATQRDFAIRLRPLLRLLDGALRPPGRSALAGAGANPSPRLHVDATAWLAEVDQAATALRFAIEHMGQHLMAEAPSRDQDHDEVARRLGFAIQELVGLHAGLRHGRGPTDATTTDGTHLAGHLVEQLADVVAGLLVSASAALCQVAILLADPQALARARGSAAGSLVHLRLEWPATVAELAGWRGKSGAYDFERFQRADTLLRQGRTPMQRQADQTLRPTPVARRSTSNDGWASRAFSALGWLLIFGWLFDHDFVEG